MSCSNEIPPPPDSLLVLPRHIYADLVQSLVTLLPPPVNNTPEGRRDRNLAAIVKIADQHPVNAYEADLAARYVINSAQSEDVMRQIRALDGDMKTYVRLHSLYNGLLRMALSADHHLRRAQAMRHAREANPTTASQDEWTHHIAQSEMLRVLDRLEPPPDPPQALLAPPAPDPAPPQPEVANVRQPSVEPPRVVPAPAALPSVPAPARFAPAQAAPARQVAARRTPQRSWPDHDEPARNLAADADHYAVLYPRRAWLIRRHGGLPPGCDFGPPDDALLAAIVSGTSRIFRDLDRLDRP